MRQISYGLCVGLALMLSASLEAAWHTESQPIMGTEVRVSLWHSDSSVSEAAASEVFALMGGIDQRLSPYKPFSDLSKLNKKAARQPVPLTDELQKLIKQAQWVYGVSDGAFDITYASVGKYYDYRQKQLPTQEQIQSLLPALSTRWLQLDEKKRTLVFNHPEVALDLGGIAKGYAVDLAIAAVQRHGVQNAYISAGGDSRVLGSRGDRPWMIGIKNPRLNASADSTEGDIVITLPLEDVAVSTSGDYERFFIDEQTGERVHHIINPKTGRSASGVMSVTVIGPQGLLTDPLSTAVFVLGVQKGISLINRIADCDAIIIDSAGQVHYSNGLMPPVQ